MAYTINLTDGSVFATIADGTINTSSSMVLVGKNYAGYGEFLDENFIHLLENGANTTAPGAPLTGQLWWDKTNNVMKVYNGSTFKVISASTASATQPTSNVAGDLWFDTVNQQLKVYNGASFILVGPASSAGEGTSGAIVNTITDNLTTDHVVIELYCNNVLVGIVSKDSPAWTPVPSIAGFSTIGAGIQLSSAVTGALFRGTATDATTLDSLNSTQFLRSDTNDTTSGTLGILNDTGLTVGLDQDAKISVNTATSEVTFANQTLDGNLSLKVNDGGAITTVFFVNGATSAVSIPSTLGVTGNVTAPFFIGNVVGSFSGNVTAPGSTQQVIFNDSGLLGASSGLLFNSSTGALTVSGNITAGNIAASGIVSTSAITKTGGNGVGNVGSTTNVFNTIFGTTGAFNAVSVESITKTGANGVGNIGSASSVFNTVFATSTSAQYADVAERFAADEVLEPGTVVELGGTAEITRAREELSETVFGVISTRAAYLMNSAAGSDETHPPVAMTGRVPVKVTGVVHKGDRLVSAGEGLARAAQDGEATPFNTIGRALTSKTTDDVGTVEAIVTIK